MRIVVALLCFFAANAAAASSCLQLADSAPRVLPASFDLGPEEVGISFVGHATYRIESPEGVSAVTDFAGFWGDGPPPDVATMNRAHSSHWTPSPDPRIEHVLRGWAEDGGEADHWLQVGDMTIRNVPTDIRTWSGELSVFGNSIFIFEVAGLCIGHLGHLHHIPTDRHYGLIGRLDVVMVPIDGSYTMNVPAMIEVLERLRARVVLPMHWFGESNLRRFLAEMADTHTVLEPEGRSITLSLRDLPERPTVIALRPF